MKLISAPLIFGSYSSCQLLSIAATPLQSKRFHFFLLLSSTAWIIHISYTMGHEQESYQWHDHSATFLAGRNLRVLVSFCAHMLAW